MTEIAFRGVRLTRGETHVLKGLDLEVAQGETLALVGRSGAGKSTILKLINRLLVPDGGEVIVRGRLVSAWDPFDLRRRIGYVLQDVGLFPHLTVHDNIAVVPRLLGWDEARLAARVDELLELVGLGRRGVRDATSRSSSRAVSASASASRARSPPIRRFS